MKEIPVGYVKFSQFLSLLFVAAGIVFKLPILLVILWLLTTLSFLLGPKANVFMLIGKLFIRPKQDAETQAVELLRFNNAIAVMFLCTVVAFFLIGWPTAAYIVAGILGAAQVLALAGFCFGCFLYFQLKQWRARKT